MPYIKQEDRDKIILNKKEMKYIDTPKIDIFEITTAGELNFAISVLINSYIEDNLSYQGINDIIGALEGAKQEFYRRVVIPYEDEKIKENGDVY